MPVMAPPLKATSSASFMPLVAACAVRTLARTDTFMPMKPQAPDSTEPTRKPSAVCQPSKKKISTSNTTPTMAMVRYWRARYAAAPCWMASAISCIRALPASWRSIQLRDHKP